MTASTPLVESSPSAASRLLFEAAEVAGSVPARFRRVAAQRPEHPAIHDGRRSLTYREVDELSDQVAGVLSPLLTEPEARVTLLFAPGEAAALVALIGVLKAGGSYAGLDPAFPLERSRALWDDAAPAVLLTDQQHARLADEIAGGRGPVLVIEDVLAAPAAPAPRRSIQADHLAALLYTSGSTGRPKGVERTHRQILERARGGALGGLYAAQDRLLLVHFIAYAAANSHLFGALLNGLTLYTLDLQQLSMPDLLALLRTEAVTTFYPPIGYFRQMMAQVDGPLDLPNLRQLGLSGEALLKSDVDLVRRQFPRTCVVLHSLSTSETGLATRFRVEHDTPITTARVPVGKPIKGVEVWLWDEAGQPVPAGEVGEVVVSTPFMARGYWRNPELTQAAFLPHPEGGARRLYRTGDLGRLLPDGNLLHLGRKDQMVKIRGYRVEPTEVELALQQLHGGQSAVVVARERVPGEAELVAFVRPTAGVSPADLRRKLAATLPAYMLPARIVPLEAWPMTASAKVDRQALRTLPLSPASRAETYEAPVGDLEQQLAGLWEAALNVRPIGRHDNFFDLGGHSLVALSLLAQVARLTGQRLRVTALFQAPTVAEMAALLRGELQVALPEAVALLQPQGQGRPLFLVPELEASAMTLVKVIRFLGTARSVYGLQPRGYVDGKPPFRTVPETAACYLDAIRAVQPKGPYLLAGLCYGGLVAFEMARQLEARGEAVPVLCAVDLPPVRPYEAGRLARLQRRLRNVRRRWQLWKKSARERVLPVLSRWRLYDRSKLDPESLRPVRYLRYAQRQASVPYCPRPYAGKLNLLLSEEFARRNRLSGWRRLTPAGLDVQVLPGSTHTDVLGGQDHLPLMAAWLAECLERADPASTNVL